MEPGDLTVSQIVTTFEAAWRVRALALEGADEAEIAAELEWRREDVREAARLQGFSVSTMARRHSLCPACGHILEPDGKCAVCALRTRLERLWNVNVEEHRREVERLENDIDAVKQDTCRVRRKAGTSPRMR